MSVIAKKAKIRLSLVACGAISAAPFACDLQASEDEVHAPFVGSAGAAFGGSPPVTVVGPASGVDTRPVTRASSNPPPVSGGTLLVLQDGTRAVASDPDRDRIFFVNLGTQTVEGSVFVPGAEPGRLIEDADGRVHVALRRSGELLTLDPRTRQIVARRSACLSARGLTYEARSGHVLVACAEGRIAEFAPSGGDALSATASDPDLRDLVVLGDRLFATRFRSAELLAFDDRGQPAQRYRLPSDGPFVPEVAWRARATPGGDMVVVHQLATTQSIFLPGFFSGPFGTFAGGAGGAGGVDGAAGAIGLGVGGEAFFDPGPSSYASGSDHCGGIVRTVVSLVSGTGAISTSPELAGSVVPVDVAVSKGGAIAVASAGFADPNQITVNIRTRAPSLAVYSDAWRAEQSCVSSASVNAPDAPTTAVAFDPLTDRLVAQTREPAALWIYDTNLDREFVIGLGADSVLDTGHEIFHRDGGGGIACASCHPEGTEDGHVWRFDSVGARRTQALDAGIQGTEPFHWGGEFANLPALIGDVLVHRMGGPEESAERMLALQDYLFGLPRRPALRDAHDPAALRGKALFDANEVGCAGCHAGGKFTNNLSLSIGKGAATQVPSLIGVGMRAPFMHDGCAQTLSERFDPACGGSAHGDTSRLSPGDLDDLSAYLESL